MHFLSRSTGPPTRTDGLDMPSMENKYRTRRLLVHQSFFGYEAVGASRFGRLLRGWESKLVLFVMD
jgi:hypothetical protein